VGDDHLQLGVLGQFTATREGISLDLGGPRQRAVLALLVIARGEVVTAERLLDQLWNGAPTPNALAVLQSNVSHLRRRLEPDVSARSRAGVIVSSGSGYSVRLGPDAVDAWRFERLLAEAAGRPPQQARDRLHAALRLWRGPAYCDHEGEPWAEAEQARLRELRELAREQLAEARLATGESALLVPELEALVAEAPLREQRWRLLVLALYRAQRQSDALAALRRARATLAEELGVDPGPALRALEAEVLAQSPTRDVPLPRVSRMATQEVREDVPSVTARLRSPSASADLVERDRELLTLRRAIDDLGDGVPGLLLIEGPAGIGKSRLLAEANRLAESAGLRVLSARGSQLERSFGFGAARQLFESELDEPGRREAALAGPAGSARGVFEQIDTAQRADGSFAVLHGLYWIMVNLTADGPLMLTVDDLQWCDAGSLRFLAYLVKRLEGLPVLIVTALRTGEQYEDESLLAETTLDPVTVPLRPAPLSAAATTAVVERHLGEAAPLFIAACHQTTTGNPLLLRQLLVALESEGVRPDIAHADVVRAVGSRAVSSLVLMRLRRMPADVVKAARAVSVLGEGAELPWVAGLAGLADEAAAEALAALSRAEVLRDDEHLAFVHPLVRDAVYRDASSAERALQHERAAELLQRFGAPAEQTAAHLLLAPRRGRATTVAVLREAARIAADRGASDSAVLLLRRALDEPAGAERLAVLIELGLLETLVDGPSGVAHLSEAYASLDDPHRRAELAVVITRTHVFASERGRAVTFARAAAAALPAEAPPAQIRDVRQALAGLAGIAGIMHSLNPAEYRGALREELAGDGVGARMLAATLGYDLLLAGEQRERAVELARFALADDRLLEADFGLLWVIAAYTRVLADDDLGDFWERTRARAHATGSLFSALATNIWRGFSEWRKGELTEALQSLTEGTEQVRMWGSPQVAAPYPLAFAIGVHLDRGALAEARRVADGADPSIFVGEGGRLLHEAIVRLLVAEDRPEDALAQLARAKDPFGISNPAWAPWRGLRAQALSALGRTGEAVQLVEDEVRLLRRWGAPSALGPSLRLLGELAGTTGVSALREAVEVLAPTSAAVELARAQLALGGCRDVSDDEAVPLLEKAAAAARSCGAAGVLRDAATALQYRGRRVDATYRQAELSRAERQILELTAAGLSIREVAQRMFLTPGTVQTTLQSASARVRGPSPALHSVG
jgi:DNA-binding SARP family transcriptional activator/tetratricopeptide (TPR) repeat protein